MSKHNLQSQYNLVNQCLNEHRILSAINQLKNMAATMKAPWEITRDIQTMEDSYGFLRQYALDGIEDPQRPLLLNDIAVKVHRVASALLRYSEIADSPRQYFATIRYEQMQTDANLNGLLDRYSKLYADLDNLILLSGSKYIASAELNSTRCDLERLATRIFNHLWTIYPLSVEHASAIEDIMISDMLPGYYKELILAAVIMGAMEYYDEQRMVLLAKIYLQAEKNVRISTKAAVGLLLNLWIHRNISIGRKLQEIMFVVSENNNWADDLKTVFLELARTRDTDRISRKLNEEVIPEMIKLRPDVLKKIENPMDPEEIMSLDENPEWTEMFEQSGLGDKLKELNEIQMDGGDVMLSTFSHLKSFSFFNDVANWLLPFYSEHSAIVNLLGDSSVEIGELISSTSMMCDSDKYSILLSLEQMPSANRRAMLEQFKAQNINLAELRNSELNPELQSRRNIINRFVQDLYRFFKLYRRKDDFKNPFEAPINLAAIDILKTQLDDTDALKIVAEFYFNHGYYEEALELYDLLLSNEIVPVEIMQKSGYCLQRIGKNAEALDMYLKCEMTNPDSEWTLRRIAQCYKLVGNNEKALEYYERLSNLLPNNTSITLNLGHCYLEAERYEEALKAYFRVDYLAPNSGKALRPLAWTLFLTGDYNRSSEYYDKVLEHGPSAADYLNIGHLNMALKQYRKAEHYYQLSKSSPDFGAKKFLAQFKSDRCFLIQSGVSDEIIDIVIDSVLES